MRIAKIALTAGLLAAGLSLGGCYGDRPGRWGDHHHRHHHHDGDHHDGHDGHHGDHDGQWG